LNGDLDSVPVATAADALGFVNSISADMPQEASSKRRAAAGHTVGVIGLAGQLRGL